MIRAFNALQVVTLFAMMPYLFQWLNTEPFAYASAALLLAVLVWLVLFAMLIAAVYSFDPNRM